MTDRRTWWEAYAKTLEAKVERYEELVSAAKAWDFAHRNPYQLNMPKCEKRLREAVAALAADTPQGDDDDPSYYADTGYLDNGDGSDTPPGDRDYEPGSLAPDAETAEDRTLNPPGDRCPSYCRDGMNRYLPLVPCSDPWHTQPTESEGA